MLCVNNSFFNFATMDARKVTPWSNAEVQALLSIVGEERVQSQLDGAHRNEVVYREVAEKLKDCGFVRTWIQCREKLKKLKSDYNKIKLANQTSGSARKEWKWYAQMDEIYGHRPASCGREAGIDSALPLLQSTLLANERASDGAESLFPEESQELPQRSQSPCLSPTASSSSPSCSSVPASPRPITLASSEREPEEMPQQRVTSGKIC